MNAQETITQSRLEPAGDGFFRCVYCNSENLKIAYPARYHRRKQDHGPFDLYQCQDCGSAITLPPPSAEKLSELYSSFEFGLSHFSRELLADNPDAAWHELCAKRLIELSGRLPTDSFTWIDVGAGGGELAHILAEKFPASRGIATDIHEKPPILAQGANNVEWRRVDLGEDAFASNLQAKGDLVFATGVWEHVRRPDIFARNVLSLLNPGGVLYMTTPNYGSLARRLFGAHWPYLIPGEHLCMPTPKGARICLRRELDSIAGPNTNAIISARPILVQYSIRFVLSKFNMPSLARLVPRSFLAHLPSGAMESVVRLPRN